MSKISSETLVRALLQGVKFGTVLALDQLDDAKVSALFVTALRRLVDTTGKGMATDRQRRLLALLADSTAKVFSEMQGQ
jgi:hypothetical protein